MRQHFAMILSASALLSVSAISFAAAAKNTTPTATNAAAVTTTADTPPAPILSLPGLQMPAALPGDSQDNSRPETAATTDAAQAQN